MLGQKELNKLRLQKQALVLESDVNRLALQTEYQNLRAASIWMSGVTQASRGLTPVLLVLAPLARLLLTRGSRRSGSWLGRIVAATKWLIPLYRLWKGFSAKHEQPAEAEEPAA